jgi:ribosomal-protein-alanine acetyltransferase
VSERDALDVRDALFRDVPAIAALAADTLFEAWSEASYAALLDAPGARVLVADAGAALVGFIVAQRIEDELHVHTLVVDRAARRRGVGRKLLGASFGERPPRRVVLEVRRSNGAARAFYASLGFEEVGVRSRYYADGEDALLLTRDRPEGPRVEGVGL